MRNPFYRGLHLGHKFYVVDAKSRIDAVKAFDRRDCEAALALPGLQTTVRQALNARLKRVMSVRA